MVVQAFDARASSQDPVKDPEAAVETGEQVSGSAGPFGMPLMVEEFLADSFLQQLFAKFFSMLHEEAPLVGFKLQSVSKQLQQLLKQRLRWDCKVQGIGQEDEDDEYAPVVVQLDSVVL